MYTRRFINHYLRISWARNLFMSLFINLAGVPLNGFIQNIHLFTIEYINCTEIINNQYFLNPVTLFFSVEIFAYRLSDR